MPGDPNLNSGAGVSIGTQAPASVIEGAGYMFIGAENSNTYMFGSTANGLQIGLSGGASAPLTGGVLTPLDAFSIDQKVDDGNYDVGGNAVGATTGIIRAFAAGSSSTNCSDTTKDTYNLSNTSTTCVTGYASDSRISPMVYFGIVKYR